MRKRPDAKPSNGWAEWSDANGTYRGEWLDGKQHGRGTFISATGVRYDGDWQHGKQAGSGEWSFWTPPVHARKQFIRKLPDRAHHEKRPGIAQPIRHSTWLREGWPKINPADLEDFAQDAVLLWPTTSLWLENQISNDFLADFFTRTLTHDSKVRVVACNQIPVLWGKKPTPELGIELWILDTDRHDIGRKDDHSEPMAILHLHAKNKFSSPDHCCSVTVKFLQISFCRGNTKCKTLWEKCSTLDERGNKHLKTVTEIEVPQDGIRVGDPQRISSMCNENPPCWHDKDPSKKYPLKDLQALGLCMSCLTLAAVHQICVDADAMRAKAYYKPGLALPISAVVDQGLRQADGRAVIFADAGLTDVLDLRMGLDALRWRTVQFDNSSKHGTESNIHTLVHDIRFCTGPMLFVFVGQLVNHGGKNYLAPRDVDFSSCSAEDWDLEMKAKCTSFDWIQSQLAEVRGTRSRPTVFLFDCRYGSISSNIDARKVVATPKVFNSVVLSFCPNSEAGNSMFLNKIQELIVQVNLELKDLMESLRVSFQEHLRLEYWGVVHNFGFVDDPPTRTVSYPAPSSLVDLAQTFLYPTVCNLPRTATAGKPSFQPRLVRIGMNPHRVSCVDWIISRFDAMKWRGTCVVHGHRGSGKTTVTSEVCFQLLQHKKCRTMFWLRGGDSFQLYFDLVFVARSLGLVSHETEMDTVIQRFRRWLGHHKGWLIVVEDVSSSMALGQLGLPLEQGMVLCTSRSAEWEAVQWENIVGLASFRQLEAHAYVLLSLPDEQPALVEQLISLLHFQQLPISLAVAYIKSEDVTVKGYIDLLESTIKKEGHKHGPADETQPSHGAVDEGTALAVTVTMEVLEVVSAAALRVAVMCACIAPSAIPRAAFTSADANDSLELLARFGLLEPEAGDTFGMHPQLQRAIREHSVRCSARQPPAEQRAPAVPSVSAACEEVLALLERGIEVLPLHNSKQGRWRPEAEPWLTHALATREHGGRPSPFLLEACALSAGKQAQDHEQGLHLLRLLRESITHTSGDDSSYARLAGVMVGSAQMLMEEDAMGEAEVLLGQALQLQEGLARSEAEAARALAQKWVQEQGQCTALAEEREALRAAAVDEQIRLRRLGGRGAKADGAAERLLADKEARLARSQEGVVAADGARRRQLERLAQARRAVGATLVAMGEGLRRGGQPAAARERLEEALRMFRTRVDDVDA